MRKGKGHLYATNISLIIGIVSLIVSTIAVFFTFTILIINIWQFIDTKRHQEWTRKEMSRKPELHLEAREPQRVDSVLNEIDYSAMIFRCDLVNSGNEGVEKIKISHHLYLNDDSPISIRVTSQTEDDLDFFYFNPQIRGTADTTNYEAFSNTAKFDTTSLRIHPNYTKCDTFFLPKLSDSTKFDTVRFPKTNRNYVTMKVHKYYGSLASGEQFKLHYVWLLWNLSPEIDTYYIPYSITSDEEIFEDTLKIKNLF